MLKSQLLQQGYLLVETLITIGILAVGLLGVSAMQVTSLKSGYSAVQRGEAAYLIAAMSDSMRANPEGVRRNYYSNLTANTTPATAARTNPQTTAQYDFDLWQQNIQATFAFDPAQPSTAPLGIITCPNAGTALRYNCILEINWMDTRAESELQTETVSTARYNHIVSIVF